MSSDAMTLGDLRRELAQRAYAPDDLQVLIHASDADGNEVFAALRSISVDPTCDDCDVLRLFADQEEEPRCGPHCEPAAVEPHCACGRCHG